MKNEEFYGSFLLNTQKNYLKNSDGICEIAFKEDPENVEFISLFRVDEVTFAEKAPRKEALENVISCMNMRGIYFVYLVLGDGQGVNFYYGVARDFSCEKPRMEIHDIGEKILKPSLQGNFRGSVISSLTVEETRAVLKSLDELEKGRVLEGVPGVNKDDEDFQSVDRIIDVMLGDTFAFMILARAMEPDEIGKISSDMYKLYDNLVPMAEVSKSKQDGMSTNVNIAEVEQIVHNDTTQNLHSDNYNLVREIINDHKENTHIVNKDSTTREIVKVPGSSGKGTHQEELTQGRNETVNVKGNSKEKTLSETTNTNTTDETIKSTTKTMNTVTNDAVTFSHKTVRKQIVEWLKYMDEVIFPRLDYGKGKGLYITTTALFGKEVADIIKLENTVRSVYAGETGNQTTFSAFDLSKQEVSHMKRFQIPHLKMKEPLGEIELVTRSALSQFGISEEEYLLGNWMSSKELSLYAGLPQKEVVGLALREEVEFGLNKPKECKDKMLLGHMIQSGVVLNGENDIPSIEVELSKEDFDKHIFVTGVTGSGKTTTCQRLLLESNYNFMVIEPAKTEYRELVESMDDLLVFTLGKDTVAPFRMNPFEFLEHESITSRVDMIMASMKASFDMEAAIPQVLESALYRCYENKGWNVNTNKNYKYENPFKKGVHSFPTLSDVYAVVEEVVEEQGFDERLKNDYIGSVKARLNGLMVGAKGQMLNTPRSIDFIELLDRKVVIELEDIKSGSEKSLIMGFLLANLIEAIKAKFLNNGSEKIKHITLVEEAHRLLSKYTPGDSLNKKQSVEMFADMLAEVRKYGEGLIIADQIPNKMTPDVLKNTNTKIVHKIFAQDDKEAIGNTMALTDEQKEYLSYLQKGRVVLLSPQLNKAIQVKVLKTEENDTERKIIPDKELRESIFKYYAETYKNGVLCGLEHLEEPPTGEELELYFQYFQENSEFRKLYLQTVTFRGGEEKLRKYLRFVIDESSVVKLLAKILYKHTYRSEKYGSLEDNIKELLRMVKEQEDVKTFIQKKRLEDALV
ncbi:MAG: ATP-binding protein [Lachnospiraceae bacterium]|nr:ATP-binding protein [Lachnospiraceae bacterium]